VKYLFGPVNSRRLGISLGIDLVNHKTCTLDCIYCECGATTELTSEIREYVPTSEVIRELDEYLLTEPELDVLTFSGSGEPTLHSGIGEVITHLKKNYPKYKIAVLTNGTLLWKKEVRIALLHADVVVPSLDAVSFEVFERVMRPVEGITPERVVQGLAAFRKEFSGNIIMEIFLVPGINDTPDELKKLKEACENIGPDLVQLNRLDRPGTEEWVQSITWKRFVEIKEMFRPLNVEIIGKPDMSKSVSGRQGEIEEVLMAVLKRRPSTVKDLSKMLDIRIVEISKILSFLLESDRISVEKMERGEFFRVVRDD